MFNKSDLMSTPPLSKLMCRVGGHILAVIPCLAWSCVLVSIIGCGRQSGPPVQFVQGKILLDGQPLEGATVDFTPDADGAGLAADGRSRADGSFTLTSVRGGMVGKGAVAGDYAVTVRKMQAVTVADVGTLISREDFNRQLRENKSVEGYQPEAAVVPRAYNAVQTSGLRVTVKKGRNVGPEFHFELQTVHD